MANNKLSLGLKLKLSLGKAAIVLVVMILPLFSKKGVIGLFNFYNRFMKAGGVKKKNLENSGAVDENVIFDFVMRGSRLVNLKSRIKIAITLIIDRFIMQDARRDEAEARGSGVPMTVLVSPTMRCNLKCEGCYAFNHSKTDDLPYEVVDRLVTEAADMGVGFMTVLGGEPFMWKGIFDLMKKHPKMFFQIYTNATFLNKETVKKIKKLGNVILMLSLEGFKEQTDARRGDGTFDRTMAAMDLLKKEGVPFGYSVTVTRGNEEIITSDKFIDMLIDKGALLGWMFLFMPVCGKPEFDLMPTPEQRLHLLNFGKQMRKTKPMIVIDFWNDAPFVGGCIAAKKYVHINSEGWAEPCIFTHLAQNNIKDSSLQEIMDSDFFRAIRKEQPYNDNLYLPCMWIDNPDISRDLMKNFKLHKTHHDAGEVTEKDEYITEMKKYSTKVAELYHDQWEKDRAGFEGTARDKFAKKFGQKNEE